MDLSNYVYRINDYTLLEESPEEYLNILDIIYKNINTLTYEDSTKLHQYISYIKHQMYCF